MPFIILKDKDESFKQIMHQSHRKGYKCDLKNKVFKNWRGWQSTHWLGCYLGYGQLCILVRANVIKNLDMLSHSGWLVTEFEGI